MGCVRIMIEFWCVRIVCIRKKVGFVYCGMVIMDKSYICNSAQYEIESYDITFVVSEKGKLNFWEILISVLSFLYSILNNIKQFNLQSVSILMDKPKKNDEFYFIYCLR